jgi:ABC-2 type transport system ATP-binding protein
MNAISVKNLSKAYGPVKALKGVSFDIQEGDFFGFLGPNGAGKTTTINCIIGLANFDRGSISVLNKDVIQNFRETRRNIGVAFQEYNFDPYLNIRDVLIYQAGYYGIKKKDAEPRAEELLKEFKLEGKTLVDYRKLSGGMKRRLALARALIHDPKILILDEPTSGVDVELRLEIHDYLKKINKQGKTILLTSHYIEEVEKLCNNIAIVDKGNIVANDSTDNLVNSLHCGNVTLITNKSAKIKGLKGVRSSDHKVIIQETHKDNINKVFSELNKQNIKVTDVKTVKDSLQDVFLRLTKK